MLVHECDADVVEDREFLHWCARPDALSLSIVAIRHVAEASHRAQHVRARHAPGQASLGDGYIHSVAERDGSTGREHRIATAR